MRRLAALTFMILGLIARPALAHQDSLAGADWVLARASAKPAPSLRFDGGRVAGTGGCNRFGGRYVRDGDKLSFAPLMSTRMACRPDIMKAEQAFFDMLARVREMRLSGETLDLMDGEGRVLASFAKRMAE